MSRKTINEDQESRAYNWALLATLILLLSLVVQTPARVVSHFLPPAVKPMVTSWGGTVWSGQANWQYRTMQGQIRWSVDPLALAKLGLGLKWELLSTASRLNGKVLAGAGRWEVRDIGGELSGQDLRGFMQAWQFPTVPVSVQKLSLVRKAGSWQGSTGRLEWQGGEMVYQINGQKQNLTLPPVELTVDAQSGPLTLNLKELQGGELATFVVNGDMLEAKLRQRLLMHSAGYQGVAEPDAVVVTSSQPLGSL